MNIEEVRQFCKENNITLIENNCTIVKPKPIGFKIMYLEDPIKPDYNIEPPKNFINGKKLNRKKRKKIISK